MLGSGRPAPEGQRSGGYSARQQDQSQHQHHLPRHQHHLPHVAVAAVVEQAGVTKISKIPVSIEKRQTWNRFWGWAAAGGGAAATGAGAAGAAPAAGVAVGFAPAGVPPVFPEAWPSR